MDVKNAADAQIPVQPGEVIAEKFEIQRVIGIGGMGVVCEALHRELRRRVAIKFVRPELSEDERFVTRFLNEARAAAALHSPHVAHVLDCGRLDSGIPYMVMENLEGCDLETLVKENGGLPVQKAVDYTLQACEALAEAHALGIVHRDIKPQNLFLTKSPGAVDSIKVLDFGVSKRLAPTDDPSVTDRGLGVGSPHYMSPEQMTAPQTVNARADIWSIGAVLYELLAARPPFQGSSIPEVCAKVMTQPPEPLHRHRPNVPARLQGVITRCLEKDPERRFGDVAEFAAALVPFASPERVASADLVSRILGRTPPPRAPVAELDSAAESEAPARQRIPGVRARWPFVLFGLVMIGAAALGVVIFLKPGRSEQGSSPDETQVSGLAQSDAQPVSGQGDATAPSSTGPLGTASDAAPALANTSGHDAGRSHLGGHAAASAGPHTSPVDPRRLPHTPGDPRDIDPPGIGDTPIER